MWVGIIQSLKKKYLSIYLTALSLSCSTQEL